MSDLAKLTREVEGLLGVLGSLERPIHAGRHAVQAALRETHEIARDAAQRRPAMVREEHLLRADRALTSALLAAGESSKHCDQWLALHRASGGAGGAGGAGLGGAGAGGAGKTGGSGEAGWAAVAGRAQSAADGSGSAGLAEIVGALAAAGGSATPAPAPPAIQASTSLHARAAAGVNYVGNFVAAGAANVASGAASDALKSITFVAASFALPGGPIVAIAAQVLVSEVMGWAVGLGAEKLGLIDPVDSVFQEALHRRNPDWTVAQWGAWAAGHGIDLIAGALVQGLPPGWQTLAAFVAGGSGWAVQRHAGRPLNTTGGSP